MLTMETVKDIIAREFTGGSEYKILWKQIRYSNRGSSPISAAIVVMDKYLVYWEINYQTFPENNRQYQVDTEYPVYVSEVQQRKVSSWADYFGKSYIIKPKENTYD